MRSRVLLVPLAACLLAFAIANAASSGTRVSDAVSTAIAKTVNQVEATPQQALAALESERIAAGAAFDWGERSEFGVRLKAYNTLMRSFEIRDLKLRAELLEAEGETELAARLRAQQRALQEPQVAQPERSIRESRNRVQQVDPGAAGKEVIQ